MSDRAGDLPRVIGKIRDGRRLTETERVWLVDVLERVRAAHTVTTEDTDYAHDPTAAAFLRSGVLAYVLAPLLDADATHPEQQQHHAEGR